MTVGCDSSVVGEKQDCLLAVEDFPDLGILGSTMGSIVQNEYRLVYSSPISFGSPHGSMCLINYRITG